MSDSVTRWNRGVEALRQASGAHAALRSLDTLFNDPAVLLDFDARAEAAPKSAAQRDALRGGALWKAILGHGFSGAMDQAPECEVPDARDTMIAILSDPHLLLALHAEMFSQVRLPEAILGAEVEEGRPIPFRVYDLSGVGYRPVPSWHLGDEESAWLRVTALGRHLEIWGPGLAAWRYRSVEATVVRRSQMPEDAKTVAAWRACAPTERVIRGHVDRYGEIWLGVPMGDLEGDVVVLLAIMPPSAATANGDAARPRQASSGDG